MASYENHDCGKEKCVATTSANLFDGNRHALGEKHFFVELPAEEYAAAADVEAVLLDEKILDRRFLTSIYY